MPFTPKCRMSVTVCPDVGNVEKPWTSSLRSLLGCGSYPVSHLPASDSTSSKNASPAALFSDISLSWLLTIDELL